VTPGPGPIYRDHNATTPITPGVAAAMWLHAAEQLVTAARAGLGRATEAG
jgi:cysteine sulfinate desulfinase/cysteine desulfurase-like protein